MANRGEIARRLIRGAHDAGCEAVAVYAADDAASPHVGEADAAVLLPGTSLAETYLSAAALVGAAKTAGADALHPGYGFLSENPVLPEACAAAGIVWVGPSPDAMRLMGHKARAKELVAGAGVPVLPSAVVATGMDAAELQAAATTVGYPLLVKASAGGGGRGMRLVRARRGAGRRRGRRPQREAAAAFGSDEVFLERFLEAPRHVEVQVIGDSLGTVLHLWDRECSVQRRHQKVVEEAPAVQVPTAIRQQMWDAAVAVARAVDYVGVGTIEYLVDGGDFFFLEMNTRLQVEHGVTELVTGLDLVGLQLVVAAGRPLPLTQPEVTASGHAVEVRLCAERPREDYRPTPGTATYVRWPEGPALRTDARHRVRQRREPRLRLPGGEADGPRPATGPPPWRSWPERSVRSSWTDSRPTGTCSARCSTTPCSGPATPTCTIWTAVPTCATRRCPRRRGAARCRGRLLPDRRAGGRQPRADPRRRVAQRRSGPARRCAHGRQRHVVRSAPSTSASRPVSSSTTSGARWARPSSQVGPSIC